MSLVTHPTMDPMLGVLYMQVANAKGSLAKIDDQLEPFNRAIEFGGHLGSSRDHNRLLRLREIAQRRVWDAEDALAAAEKVQVHA